MAFCSCLLVLAVIVAISKQGCATDGKDVHVIFSNHLDIGFNSDSPDPGDDNRAINAYFDRHFLRAVETANWFRAQNSSDSYQYLTHSWLISMYLDCPLGMGLHCPSAAAKQAVETAIRRGDITWHALPFNGQAEYFDAPLLQYAVFLTRGLDDHFNVSRKTVASLRDVPGMTRSAIPILAGQGVVALSQGVNGGSAPPAVPHDTPYLWRDVASGTELLAMLHPGGYSGEPVDRGPAECVTADSFDHVLCYAWKGDNAGPHTAKEAQEIFELVRGDFPGARVFASSLDAYVAELQRALPGLNLPVVTQEIGDTWIHGVASDAHKTAKYRAILRMRRAMLWRWDQPAFLNFSRILLKVPEHTWGLDVKTTLADWGVWSNKDFHRRLEERDQRYVAAVQSWQRQASYLDWALDAIDLNPQILEHHMPSTQPSSPELSGYTRVASNATFSSRFWTFAIDPGTERLRKHLTDGTPCVGGLAKLERQWPGGQPGTSWASKQHPLGTLTYSTYTEDDFRSFLGRYAYMHHIPQWLLFDFGKPNCSLGDPVRADEAVSVVGVWQKEDDAGGVDVLVLSQLPEWTYERAGGPKQLWTRLLSPAGDFNLYMDISWVEKALWLRFAPDVEAVNPETWQLYKLGMPVSPLDVVVNGSHNMHAVSDEGVAVTSRAALQETLYIRTLDAALVSPGKPTPFPQLRGPPDLTHGMSFNLANNIWGTNYVMWQPFEASGTNMTFRFVMQAELPAHQVALIL